MLKIWSMAPWGHHGYAYATEPVNFEEF